jgi:ABC-2 type transport system permease protein
MSMAVKKYGRLLKEYFLLNLSAAMEYRAAFITQVLGMTLNNALFVFFWWVIFNNTGSIGNYSFRDVMGLWAIVAVAFGFSFIVFGNAVGITELIMKGGLDVYLLQPKNVLFNVICSKTVVSAWGDLLYGYILFFILYGPSPGKFLMFTLFAVAGGLLFTSVMILVHSLTFYMGNASGIAGSVFEFLLNFSLYPEDIFRGYVKFIVYSLIPAGFITFIPLKVLRVFDIRMLLLILVFDIAYFSVAAFVFYRGLRKYESGNLITGRI